MNDLHQELANIRNRPFEVGNVVPWTPHGPPVLELPLGPEFLTSTEQLGRHMVVMGTTGAGKSKFLELFGRHLIDHLCGFTFIDPHGDTVEALLEYATGLAENYGDDIILDRLHYLKPSYDSIFAFDPFRYSDGDIPQEHIEMAFQTWLHTTSDNTTQALLRGYTDAERQIMVRLQRWLGTFLSGVGTRLESGAHLPLADIFVLLDQRHKRHADVYSRLKVHMPPSVVADFELLHSIKRHQDEDHYVESTINRLRAFFSPLTECIFTNQVPSIDFANIVKSRHILLVNLRKTKHFSRQQGTAIANLILNEIRTHCENVEYEELRTPHHLIIDEAGSFIAEDLIDLLEQARKWKLSVCLGGQSFSTFKSGEVDMIDAIQSCCHSFISFQQRNEKDVEELGRFFSRPNRILAERMSVQDRPGGHVFVPVIDQSIALGTVEGKMSTRSHVDSRSQSVNAGRAKSRSTVESQMAAVGRHEASSWQHAEGGGDSLTQGSGAVTGSNSFMLDGVLVEVPNTSHSRSDFGSSSASRSFSDAKGGAIGVSTAEGTGHARGDAESRSIAFQAAAGQADGEAIGNHKARSATRSISIKHTALPITREDLQPTGQPRYALDYQDDAHATALSTLPDQYAFIRIKQQSTGRDATYLFRTADVVSTYSDVRNRREKVGQFTRRLLASKPYIFTPSLPSEQQDERIDQVLQVQRPPNSARTGQNDGSEVPGDNPYGM